MRREIEGGIQVSVWMSKEELLRMDRISKKVKVSRSRMMRNFVMLGLDQVEMLDSVGIITLFLKAEELRDKLHGAVSGSLVET